MKRLTCILLLFCALTKAQDVFSIKGIVSTEKGETVPGAIVFLTGTKQITSSNNSGKFILSDLLPGNYEIVVKMLGYIPYVKTVQIQSKSAELVVRLKENMIMLKTVAIKSTDPNREKYLALFKKNFLGETANASQCKILNPQCIEFHFDKNTDILTAKADKILIIENSGLGYRLNYLLTNFETDVQSLHFLFTGYPYFEELSGTELQQRQWNENRKIAYAGSLRHFFRAIFSNTAETDGFSVFKMGEMMDGKRKISAIRPLPTDSLFTSVDKNFKLLKEKYNKRTAIDTTELFVVYRGGRVPYDFTPSIYVKLPVKFSSSRDQLSKMQPITDDIVIYKNGTLITSKSFLLSGFWAWQRMADLTPSDYITDVPHILDKSSKNIELISN